MIARTANARAGYTLLELIVVIAVLVLLGAIVSSSMTGQSGNTKVKAAADDATGLIASARSHAIEEGRNYRLAVSQDGTKLRVTPDDPAAVEQSGEDLVKPFNQQFQLEPGVTVVPTITGSEMSTADAEGWVRLATFQQDGTCREDLVDFEIREQGVTPLVVQIRGLTGHTTVNPAGASKK